MKKEFLIKKVCREENRPPYSYKLDEYFEGFVNDHLLEPFQLFEGAKWNIVLSIMIFSSEISNPNGISFYEPSEVEEDLIQFYPVAIRLEDIYGNDIPPVENVVSLYFQIISIFFLTYYSSKVSRDYMLSLKDKVDWDFLLSLPYPAPFSEQKYLGD